MTNLILTAALKGTIVLAAAWIATALLRRRSADLRHRIWLVALFATALLLIPWPAPAPISFVATAELGAGKAASTVSHSFPRLPVLWLAGVALVLMRFGAGVLRLFRITQLSRAVGAVRVSESIQTPMTWGAIKPVILLPTYVDGWSVDQRDVVVRHERAHIERRDWLWQTFAQLTTAVFWFHPLVWLAAAKLRRESEHAADDVTLSTGVEAPDYADRLMAVARKLHGDSLACAVAMVRQPALASRIAAILDTGRTRTVASAGSRIGIVMVAVALLVPLSAFQNRTVYKAGVDGVTAPSIVYKVNPSYSPEAKAAKIEGTVALTMVVNSLGQVDDIQVTRSLDPQLDANAVTAVSQWLFHPGTKDGQPVDVGVAIEINFRLL